MHAARLWPLGAALLAFALHLPFVVRYDLHFQNDFAISTLISQSIVEGERPVFFWGQAYLGTYGNYLTAALFRVFGASVPLAGTVALAIWASGVGLATWLAGRVLGGRAAFWTGVAAAVASPYANHYVTQPYSSYETAPVLVVLLLAGLLWGERLLGAPWGLGPALGWAGLGLVLGLGWWTTRLFLPGAVAVALAVALRGRWSAAAPRRAAAAAACLLPGLLVGASPDVLYRLGYVRHETLGVVGSSTFDLAVAPPAKIPGNLLAGLRAIPAYFDGDPVARHPEGLTFIGVLVSGRQPYAGPEFAPGRFATLIDWLAAAAAGAVLLVAARTAARAWRERDLPVLALCVVPFVHLALIALSGRTNGSYFEARRYWFGSLLVFPLLAGNAIARAEVSSRAALRACAHALIVLLLVASLVDQVRMLALPDELTALRPLVGELTASGERAVLMPGGGSSLVAALSGATITAAGDPARNPRIAERVAASEHIAVVVSAAEDFRHPAFTFDGHAFEADGSARGVGGWRIYGYRAAGRPDRR